MSFTVPRYRAWITAAVFVAGSIVAGATVAGPGLSWDEPAYRHSQVTLAQWFGALWRAPTWSERQRLFAADAIDHYWEFNRFGHNFHPPMASYANLVTWSAAGRWIDDLCARRLASALEFAGVAAMLCHFLGRRLGMAAGLFAAASVFFMPRLMGDAHLVGTDMPLLFFWVATALAF